MLKRWMIEDPGKGPRQTSVPKSTFAQLPIEFLEVAELNRSREKMDTAIQLDNTEKTVDVTKFGKEPLATYAVGKATDIRWQYGCVSTTTKEDMLKQKGCVLWFTGLSGSGKSTVACTLEHALAAQGKLTSLLDGDNIRHGLNSNLGFSPDDRSENIRRIGEVSKLFADTGIITIVSFISPYVADREKVRSRLAPGQFIEIYMSSPLDVCEARDPKGLYKKARAGQIKGFTGIDPDAPYEAPVNAEIVIEAMRDGDMRRPEDQAGQILEYLRTKGYLSC